MCYNLTGVRDRDVGHHLIPSLVQAEVEVLPEVDGVPADADRALAEAAQGMVPVSVEESGTGVSVGEAGERCKGPRGAGVGRPDRLAVLNNEVVAREIG